MYRFRFMSVTGLQDRMKVNFRLFNIRKTRAEVLTHDACSWFSIMRTSHSTQWSHYEQPNWFINLRETLADQAVACLHALLHYLTLTMDQSSENIVYELFPEHSCVLGVEIGWLMWPNSVEQRHASWIPRMNHRTLYVPNNIRRRLRFLDHFFIRMNFYAHELWYTPEKE
jgi:hypothetical protein